jgi:hypothetical protein
LTHSRNTFSNAIPQLSAAGRLVISQKKYCCAVLRHAALSGKLGDLHLSKTPRDAIRTSRSTTPGVRARLTHGCAQNFFERAIFRGKSRKIFFARGI